jgi:hydrogenase nickel incorporation protein HypA/HybF
MHELSIVEALIEQAEKEVKRSGQEGRVVGLDVVVGRLSGVNCDSIRFAFELLSDGTRFEHAELRIAEPKATCRCDACHAQEEIDELAVCCPRCASPKISIKGGRDLLLESIEIEN